MSLFGALGASVTGLGIQGEALSVVSDNLANVNTVGFKRNRTIFSQLVTSSGLSGTQFNAGGAGIEIQRSLSAQGALIGTDRSTDLALDGNGFFVTVGDTTITNDTPRFFTRAGSFGENSLGFLQHTSGTFLLGWRTNSDGSIQDIQNPEAIELQSVGSSARQTTQLNLGANIDAESSIFDLDTGAAPATIDPGVETDQGIILANLDNVANDLTLADFVPPARFFDSQGDPHDVSIAFTKRGENLWDYVLVSDGSNIVNQTAGTNVRIGSGTVEFNTDGSLKNQTVRDVNGNLSPTNELTIPWAGGVEAATVDFNFGDFSGGLVFNESDLDGANVFVSQGITSVSIDESKATDAGIDATQPFQIHSDGAGGIFIVNDPAGANGGPFTSATVTIPSPLLESQTFEFDNGLSITLDQGYTVPAAGQIGADFSATTVLPRGTGSGTNGLIQFSSPDNTRFINQDGFASGTLASVAVDEEGFVIGAFTNGETQRLFKLVVAVFQDPAGLDPVSGSLFQQTNESGAPLFQEAGIGNTATVASGSLEQSTVDVATEFTDMIVAQRAFSASSKVVTTVDQMLAELLSLR